MDLQVSLGFLTPPPILAWHVMLYFPWWGWTLLQGRCWVMWPSIPYFLNPKRDPKRHKATNTFRISWKYCRVGFCGRYLSSYLSIYLSILSIDIPIKFQETRLKHACQDKMHIIASNKIQIPTISINEQHHKKKTKTNINQVAIQH